jgi:L-lactate dehydrogenase complex protein LldG
MQMTENARATVLNNIRTALGKPVAEGAIALEYASLSRAYKRVGTLDRTAILELFTDRLLEYDAGVYRTAAAGIGAEAGRILTLRGMRHIAIPDDLPAEWLPEGFDFQKASGFDENQLDRLDGLFSGCTVAIAETGSIVLQNAPAQGPRRMSLVPDYQLCVVFAGQVVETVPESFARLEATATLPTTFLSGPSATADIEMTRIKGVHGPRFLDVLLVV